MYSTCLFCHAALGRNDALEHFPVSHRLAYDAAKGRLWVVCRRCERWNLTPLEERWEAIDEAERLYRGTRLRASTENVGLARAADGTELVRIGAPLRPEFAAWRYGDQFGRRRRRHVLLVCGGIGVAGTAAIVSGPVLGILSFPATLTLAQFANVTSAVIRINRSRVSVRLDATDAPLRLSVLGGARLVPEREGAFSLELAGSHRLATRTRNAHYRLTGAAAVRAAAQLLPAINRGGGSRSEVQEAVRMLDAARSVEDVFAGAARRRPGIWTWALRYTDTRGELTGLDATTRLALEMASHEEQERRAMDGELAELERAWRDAEEIAAIADDLLLPASVGERFGQLKERSTARAGDASSPTSDSGSATSS